MIEELSTEKSVRLVLSVMRVCVLVHMSVCVRVAPSGHVVSWLHLWRSDKRDSAVPWD